MFRKMMRAKIHRATVTQCVPDYVGSITIDANLLEAVDIRPNEAVHVLDIDNGNRFETYVFRGEPGTGIIAVNGAAAKLVENGHKVIIVSYGMLLEENIDDHISKTVIADEHNQVQQKLTYNSLLDMPPESLAD